MNKKNLVSRFSLLPDGHDKKALIYSVLLFVIVILVYTAAIDNNFVDWDDNDYVINNKLVRTEDQPDLKEIFTTVVSLNYHPLTILSLSMNNNTCRECPNGISPAPFIKTNITLHGINTLLVFLLILFLFRNNLFLAFVVAAIFGLHPMHVESVAWISGRKDVLSTFFFLSGLLTYFQFLIRERNKYLWLLFSFVLFVCATLSKATTVVFPVVALLICYFHGNSDEAFPLWKKFLNIFALRKVLPLLPFFAVSLLMGLIAARIQNGHNFMELFKFIKAPHDVVGTAGSFSLLERTQIASFGFFTYLVKFFVPVNQTVFYPYPTPMELSKGSVSALFWIALISIVITTALVVISMKKTKIIAFGYGFFLINLILVLHFVTVGNSMMAERYTYIPYIGLSVIPFYFISGTAGMWKRLFYLITGIFILIMILITRKQIEGWHDSGTLWTQAINRDPLLELARGARGKYYFMQSSLAKTNKEKSAFENKAIKDFKIAIEQKTSTPDVYEAMGVILQSRGELKTALQYLNIAVRLDPEKGRTYFNRAIIYDQMNQKEEAIRDYESALAKSPEMILAIMRNKSALYLETGKYEMALKDLNVIIKIDPREFIHYYNRAFCRVMMRDYDGAISDYQVALKLNPGDIQTIEQLRILTDIKKKM